MESFIEKLPRIIQQKLLESSKGMYTKKVLPNGRIQVTGGKRLKSSGAYPRKFGQHVAKLLIKQKIKVS